MADTEILVSFRTCLRSELPSRAIIPGSIIMCSDTGDLYHDNSNSERLHVAKSVSYFETDAERQNFLIPETDMLYIVKETNKFWIYTTSWKCLNPDIEVGTFVTVKTWTTSDITTT